MDSKVVDSVLSEAIPKRFKNIVSLIKNIIEFNEPITANNNYNASQLDKISRGFSFAAKPFLKNLAQISR